MFQYKAKRFPLNRVLQHLMIAEQYCLYSTGLCFEKRCPLQKSFAMKFADQAVNVWNIVHMVAELKWNIKCMVVELKMALKNVMVFRCWRLQHFEQPL